MAVPTFIDKGTTAESGTTPIPTTYSSTAVLANDIAILAAMYLGNDLGGTSLDGVFSMLQHGNSTTSLATFGAYKRCAGGEESDVVNFDVSSGAIQRQAVLCTFRGCIATGNPSEGAAAATGGTGNTATAPDIVTTGPDRLGVVITAHRGAGTEGSTATSGWTRVSSWHNIASGRNLQVFTKSIAGDSDGVTEPGPVVTYGTTSNSWAAVSFALIPAAGAAGVTGTGSHAIALSLSQTGTGIAAEPAAQEATGAGDQTIDLAITQAGDGVVANRKLLLTAAQAQELRDENGAPVANLSGIAFEWYDKITDTDGDPVVTGTFGTNGSGEVIVPLFGTALAAAQEGTLILEHPSDSEVRGIYRLAVN